MTNRAKKKSNRETVYTSMILPVALLAEVESLSVALDISKARVFTQALRRFYNRPTPHSPKKLPGEYRVTSLQLEAADGASLTVLSQTLKVTKTLAMTWALREYIAVEKRRLSREKNLAHAASE